MLLTLDIKQMAGPLVGKTKGIRFATIKTTSAKKEAVGLKLSKKLDVFILAIEGAYQHVKELDEEKATKLLQDTNRIIEDFYSLDDLLLEKNYLSSQELKKKIKYLFKTLYKFESILHKTAYKNTPLNKTSQDIIDGISKINKNTISKLVY